MDTIKSTKIKKRGRKHGGGVVLKTVEEIAVVLGVSKRTVMRLTEKGRIPHIRISGRTVRYLPADVLAALVNSTE